MILPALIQYYDLKRSENDPLVPRYGYQLRPIAFEVVLSASAEAVINVLSDSGTDTRSEVVPAQDDWLNRTSKMVPGFLCDNAEYLLGVVSKSEDRARARHSAFVRKHLDVEGDIQDEAFSVVCSFLRSLDGSSLVIPNGIGVSGLGVFRLAGQDEFVHDRDQVGAYWESVVNSLDGCSSAPSILDGSVRPVARIHGPAIRGVAKNPGDPLPKLVSFDKDNDAWCSYGKEQGDNAPVGVKDAFKYCTALNRLTRDPNRCVHLGDTTVVFWAERESAFETELMPAFLKGGTGEDQQAVHDIRNALSALSQGRAVRDIQPETPFYVLGLAPNAARLSVRLWLVGTIGAFAGRIASHLDDLALEPTPESADLTIRRIIAETAPPKGGWADEGAISPLLAGSVLRAVLSGGAYPQALLAAVVARARTEGLADSEKRKDWLAAQHRRCAIIKACLLRAARAAGQPKEIPVSLNEDHPDPAYHLGRLFAAFEHVQTDALGRGINATIKDRYFGSASSTPAAVFPRLIKLHQHHMDKLDGGLRVVREKLVQEIFGRIDKFPSHLSLNDQGLFSIGYYHQRQALFTKKSEQPEATTV